MGNTKEKPKLNLMRIIPRDKIIVVAFSGGESSAYMLELLLQKYRKSNRIIICFCNTGEEDEETLIFAKKIAEYHNVEVVWLEYAKKRGFKIVDFETAYRKTKYEIDNRYPNHPFRTWVEDYGMPQYPKRTCTREMKERTISRYLSSIKAFPRFCVRCVGIRFDEIGKRTPDPKQYYELILQGVTKKRVNGYFEYEMPFRLQIPSYEGNCGACISKALRNLCTIARYKPEKFDFFRVLAEDFGQNDFPFYREYNTIDHIFDMAENKKIQDAHDNRYDLEEGPEFNTYLDSEGACGGTCEAFT